MRGWMFDARTRRTSWTISMPMKSFFVCSQNKTMTSSVITSNLSAKARDHKPTGGLLVDLPMRDGSWASTRWSRDLSMKATRSSMTATSSRSFDESSSPQRGTQRDPFVCSYVRLEDERTSESRTQPPPPRRRRHESQTSTTRSREHLAYRKSSRAVYLQSFRTCMTTSRC